MPKDVVEIACTDCGRLGWVKADKRDWYYFNCSHPATVDDNGDSEKGCGVFKYQTESGQRRLRQRAKIALAKINEVPPQPMPEPEPEDNNHPGQTSDESEPSKKFSFFSR